MSTRAAFYPGRFPNDRYRKQLTEQGIKSAHMSARFAQTCCYLLVMAAASQERGFNQARGHRKWAETLQAIRRTVRHRPSKMQLQCRSPISLKLLRVFGNEFLRSFAENTTGRIGSWKS